ncbi:uncharacterized protein LOC135815693 [Sycon ciliatum]|uniref:uncharacterized protein LOC135815693 n=1 Tax=Sycon ciliatum TaxID=27933 RepID=UPI0031F600FD
MANWQERTKSALRKVGAFAFKHHLPLGLLFAVLLGALWPTPGVAVSKIPANYICVILIFLLSGLKLKTDDVKEALKSWKGIVYGIFSILFLTSVVSLELIKLMSSQFGRLDIATVDANGSANSSDVLASCTANTSEETPPLGPREFSTGLQVFFAMPCTVSSGVVMVTQLNGNYALALLLTVVCNLVGIGTVPGLLNWLAEFDASVKLDAAKLLLKLVLTLLIPLLVGKALRFIPKVVETVDKYRVSMKVAGNVFLIILPWIKISVTSDKGSFDCIQPLAFLALFGISLGLHALLLAFNSLASLILRLEAPVRKAVVILCSQKTLAVALSVLSFFPASLGDQGLMAIPCIIAHLVQIVADAVLISGWLGYDRRQELKQADTEASGQPYRGDAMELQLINEEEEEEEDQPEDEDDPEI